MPNNGTETKKRKVTSYQHNVADEILQVIDTNVW
jgi:hypothetical protein